MEVTVKNCSVTEPFREYCAVQVYPSCRLSELYGFGGAFTEAAAYNYAQLTKEDQQKLIEWYFSAEKGMGYRFCRVHMGSCDFSLSEYSVVGKADLSDFSIERDKKYVLPFVKDALREAGDELFLFASPWSPPAFMKTNESLLHGGELKKEYYEPYAQCFVKFIKAYAEEGVTIQAVTVQNEPEACQTWESCHFTAQQEAEFAVDYLRPALDKAGLKDVKILVWDHNKESLFDRATAVYAYPGAKEALWGTGFHWYSGNHFDTISLTRQAFPDKVVVETELCHGDSHDKTPDERAMDYAVEYCMDLHHGTAAVCDWNMILDIPDGGPFHCRNTGGCYAPVYVDQESKALSKDAIFSVIEAFASKVSPGDISLATSCYDEKIKTAAVQKKDGRVVLFAVNTDTRERMLNILLHGKCAPMNVAPQSLSVFILE